MLMNRGPAMWWGNERAAIWKPRREASVESNPAGTLSLNSNLLYVGESKFLLFVPFHLCYLGEGNGTPLHYSCRGNPMDRGAWWATVHGVAKSRTWLSDSLSLFTFMRWRRKWQPTLVFLPGESKGWGSLVGCHLWVRTESGMTDAT